MDFVHEEKCGLTGCCKPLCGGGQGAAHFRHVRLDPTESFKMGLGVVGNDLSQSRFAGSGRAIENE